MDATAAALIVNSALKVGLASTPAACACVCVCVCVRVRVRVRVRVCVCLRSCVPLRVSSRQGNNHRRRHGAMRSRRRWRVGAPSEAMSRARSRCLTPPHICTRTRAHPRPHLHQDSGSPPPTSAPGRTEAHKGCCRTSGTHAALTRHSRGTHAVRRTAGAARGAPGGEGPARGRDRRGGRARAAGRPPCRSGLHIHIYI
jgi:hypothetical protein